MAAELQCELLRQTAEPVLRHRVGAAVRERRVLVDGGDVDDAAAAALLDHEPRRTLRAQKGAVEVDRERVLPVVVGELEQFALPVHACVVDEHVEAPERSGEVVDHVCRAGEVREVEPPHLRTSVVTTNLVRGLLGSLLVLVPRDTDVEAVGGEADRRRTAIPESEPVTIATGIRRAFHLPRERIAQMSPSTADRSWTMEESSSKLRTRHRGRSWSWTSTAPRR